MPDVGVVIAAGGRGRRMARTRPKQFLLLGGQQVICRAIAPFSAVKAVAEIVVVVPAGYVASTRRLLRRSGLQRIGAVVSGGKERQDSVWKGLTSFSRKPDIVLVHDAVRPFVTTRLIEAVIRQARRHRGAVVGLPVTDTIKVEGSRGFYRRTLQRANLWAVQTPQAFSYDLLLRAHSIARKHGYRGTDEASLLERLHIPVKIVPGERFNIKITTEDDLLLAGALLGAKKTKSGRGVR